MQHGQMVKGYELRERIGSGGFGVVHRAYQSTVGREVAIKLILPHFAKHPDFIRRFETESQIITRLEHLHIVPLYDFWRDREGAYLVMRWLRGGNLHDALQKGPFDLPTAAHVLDQISSALAAAHRNDVVHRDLKPTNILFDEEGNAYLADFGIAKDMGSHEGGTTASDVILGSPGYIAPEQARRERARPQADIYSLGVVLYEMLSGEHPFPDTTSVDRIYKHLYEPLPRITLDNAIAEDVNRVIQQATAKDPALRYTGALEMAAMFRAAADQDRTQTAAALVEQLTQREHQILQLIRDGYSNKDIAQQLFITVSTVKWHVRQLYSKLRVRNRMQAIVRARELNLFSPDMGRASTESVNTCVALPEPCNPYKGLRAFQPADAPDFFGRERLIQRLIERMAEDTRLARFLAVVGPSGSGKSSLVKAGLVPALWRGDLHGSDRWFVVDMMPGARPLDELEIALTRVAADQADHLREQLERDEHGLLRVAGLILPGDDSELVLIIDQFEEVFTLVENEEARQHFLDLIQATVTDTRSRVRVVVTLRADFYDRPLYYPKFGELMRQRTEIILPLSADELEAAIVKPASRVGVLFEDGLVTTITLEVNYQPGALPLLQHALYELFAIREGRTLTQHAFQEIGGACRALAQRADALYREQEAVGQETIRQMFLRLVMLGEGTEDTRRRVHWSELRAIAFDPDVMDELIDTYAACRLLSLDHDPVTRSPTVEVAHEALLREWQRLREWLNICRDDVRLQRQLSATSAEWHDAAHDASYLLHGTRLEQFERWSRTTELALTPGERAYLDTSIVERNRQTQFERERQAREAQLERRAHRVLQGLVGLFLFATVISVVLALFALNERSTARQQRDNAQQERDSALRQAAVNRSLVVANDASVAYGNANTDLALLLALEATRIDEPPADAVRILETIGLGLGMRAIWREHGPAINSVAFGPDSQLALSGGCVEIIDELCVASELILWDIETGTERRRFEGPTVWVNDVAFGPDGRTALAAYADGTIILWDTATGECIRQLRGHNGAVNSAAFSPDGTLIASGGADSVVLLWNTHSGEVIYRLEGHTDEVTVVTFSPDGELFASSSDDKTSILWNTATGEPLRRFEGHTTGITAAAFRPVHAGASATFLSIAANNLREWNLETGETIHVQEMPCLPIDDLVVSSSGRIAVTDQCGTIDLWDLDEWHSRQHANVLPDPVSLAISPDGRFLLSGYSDGALYLLNMPASAEIRRFKADIPLVSLDLSPDGRYLLTGAMHGGIAILWDTQTGEEIRQFEGYEGAILALGFSLNGRHAVIASADWWGNSNAMKLALVDITTGEEMVLEGHEFGIRTFSFSPDGRALLTGSVKFNAVPGDDGGNLILWDTQTGAQIRRFEEERSVFAIRFSADGRFAFTGSNLQTDFVKVWDVSTGHEIDRLEVQGGILTLLLGPEEDTLLADLKLVDLQSKEIIRRFRGHRGGIVAADISDDGRYLISGDSQGGLFLWDFASGEEIRQLTGHTAAIWGLAFSPDGQTAFSSAFDGTVRQWQIGALALDNLLDWISANRYIREFTCDERDEYRIEPLCE